MAEGRRLFLCSLPSALFTPLINEVEEMQKIMVATINKLKT